MSNYTPTTGAILNGYVHYRETQGKSADYSMDEFQRWLAEHDRQVKAQALEEAANAFNWAGWHEDYKPFQDWLRTRANRLKEEA